jgi:hypothetical protein
MKLFPIRLGVQPEAVGATLEALKKMRGVMKIDLDLDKGENGKNGKPNGSAEPRGGVKKFVQKAEDFILELLVKGQPIPTRVMRDHFDDVGRRPGSTSSALNLLKKDGLIKHDDNKAWVLTKKARDRMRGRKKSK